MSPSTTDRTSERPLVCDVCWKKDGWKRDGKNGLKLLRCRECGVCVHAECYGWAEPIDADTADGTLSEFCCWGCLAVGTVVKVRESDPETGQRKQIRITDRPTECCLCSVDEGMEVPHAMHPMFDDYGPRARQILLPAEKGGAVRQPRPERTAWAHTICCMVLSTSSGGVVYGLTREGYFDGEDDVNDSRVADDESVNSALGNGKCKSAQTITHFGHILERFYKKGSLYLKNKREYQSLKCIDCGANDQARNVYRIPIQCTAGDKKEHTDFHGCHTDLGTDTCYQPMHVGCAFYGKNEHGEYPAVRRVYYFPGDTVKHIDVVANCFCLKHAADVSTLPGCGSTKYPKGSKQAPRLYNHTDESTKNSQSLLYFEGQIEPSREPFPGASWPRHSSSQNSTKSQLSQRRPSHQQPLQSKRRHSQQQQQQHPQQHPRRSSETRSKTASNPSRASLFFSNIETAAPTPASNHSFDADFEKLVAELRTKESKKERTIMKKQWLRRLASCSSDKFNAWWDRALDRSKEPCDTATSKSARSHADDDDGNQHLSEDRYSQRGGPSNGYDEKLKHDMIQAVSKAVAQLGVDKKKDPELVCETVHEKRSMFRKQLGSMPKSDFNSLWKDVREKVGQTHGISIPLFKKRKQSEHQQGPRKLPPDVANAIAAASATGTASGEPLTKKRKLDQDSTLAMDTATSSTSATMSKRAGSKNDSAINDKSQMECLMDGEEATEPLTTEQSRFQKMVQDVDDESAAQRQVPLQVILRKQRQQWEKHAVREGPPQSRLSDMEFASLWKRVEQRASENWERRIQTATTPMDWSFLVFGKQFDEEKVKTYCDEWDTMDLDEI